MADWSDITSSCIQEGKIDTCTNDVRTEEITTMGRAPLMATMSISKTEYLRSLGFNQDPFQYYNADEEDLLEKYFVDPPYFVSLWGDIRRPQSHVVFAPRGAGKSAQRRMIEAKANDENVFVITYDRFPGLQSAEQADLAYHIKNLNRLALQTLFLRAPSSGIFDAAERTALARLVELYLGDIDLLTFKTTVQDILPLPARLKKFWNDNLPAIGVLSQFIRARWGLANEGTPMPFDSGPATQPYSLSADPMAHFELIMSMVPKVATSCFVLVDKVDEPGFVENNPEKAFRLIQPLLTDLRFINSGSNYGVKFFLWDALEPYYRRFARPDRVQQYRLRWRYQELVTMINRRLAAYSSDRVTGLNQLFDVGNVDIYFLLIAFSNNSPRAIIEMLDDIVDEHLRLNPTGGGRIGLQSLDRGIKKFCNEKADLMYGPELVQELKRIKNVGFTTSFLSNDLYKSMQVARNRIRNWEEKQVIKPVCTLPTSRKGRPSMYYMIQDAILAPLIMETTDVATIVQDKAIKCSQCDRIHFVHLEHFEKVEGDVGPSCPSCGSKLI